MWSVQVMIGLVGLVGLVIEDVLKDLVPGGEREEIPFSVETFLG